MTTAEFEAWCYYIDAPLITVNVIILYCNSRYLARLRQDSKSEAYLTYQDLPQNKKTKEKGLRMQLLSRNTYKEWFKTLVSIPSTVKIKAYTVLFHFHEVLKQATLNYGDKLVVVFQDGVIRKENQAFCIDNVQYYVFVLINEMVTFPLYSMYILYLTF